MCTLARELGAYRHQGCWRVTTLWLFATTFIVLTLASVQRAISDDWIDSGLTQAVWIAPLGQFERGPGVTSAVNLATAEAADRVLGPRSQDEEDASQIDQPRESTISDGDGALGSSSIQPLPSWLNAVNVGIRQRLRDRQRVEPGYRYV
jgi:hypothetical protein